MTDLHETRFEGTRAVVELAPPRLDVEALDGVYRHAVRLLSREGLTGVEIDLRRVDAVDNSLVNTLRAIAYEARRRHRIVRLRSIPTVLRYVLSSPSHRLRWAAGLLSPADAMPTTALGFRRRRPTWRRVA